MAGLNFGQELVVYHLGNRVSKATHDAWTNKGELTVPGTGPVQTRNAPRMQGVMTISPQKGPKPGNSNYEINRFRKKIKLLQKTKGRSQTQTTTKRRTRLYIPSLVYPSRRKKKLHYSYVARNR